MKKIIFLLLSCSVLAAQTNVPTLAVSEIKPGMRGTGKTVFVGETIEEFDFEVLDIWPNFRSKQDLILVKLLGEKVEYINAAHGMSGSPMYIDGKLVGALSLRIGIFPKDPIAAITPIEQMLKILEKEKARPAELAINSGFNAEYLDMAVGVQDVSIAELVPPYLKKQPFIEVTPPVETANPLDAQESFGIQFYSEIFTKLGFNLYSGSSGNVELTGNDRPLQPGSAYSVVLVEGDLNLDATGTVTYVDDSQIIGMGHPVFNFGAVNLPMGRAKILTTLADLMRPSKLSALTEIVGTIHQDRTSGVMGIQGEIPQMLPFNLSIKSGLNDENQFSFRIAEDRGLYSITPLIVSIVLTNALESARMSMGNRTLQLQGEINLRGHESIQIENYYAGTTPSGFVTDAIQAAGDIASVLGALLSNNFEKPAVESINLNFQALSQKNIASVQKISANKTSVKAGESVQLTVEVQEFQGRLHKIVHTLQIPTEINARRISIFAGSGASLTRVEARLTPQKFRPSNFEQLTKLLNNRRKNNFVFFQLRKPDQGVIIKGHELPGLPPSVLSVLQTQKSSGDIAALRDRVLSESQVETDYAVYGGKAIWLTIDTKN